jgi:hypothetical protein
MEYQNEQQKDLFYQGQRALPNATAVLVLGILSIVLCFICGIVALVLASGDKKLYDASPESYTSGSYDLVKAGRICSIIGLCLWGVVLIIYIFFFAVMFKMGAFNN